MTTLSYIFGFLGICSTVIIYQQKSRRTLLISKLISDLIWFLHYFFLEAYSGAAIAVLGAVRELVFVNREKRLCMSRLWLPFFIVASIICNILTWQNIFSSFTLVASCISVIGFFIGKPALSRLLSFPISVSMLTYDVACGSILGIANEFFALTSSFIGFLFIDRKTRIHKHDKK